MPQLRKQLWEFTSGVRAITLFVPKIGQKTVIFARTPKNETKKNRLFEETKVSNRKSQIAQCKWVVVMPQLRKQLWEFTSGVRAITLFVPKIGQKTVIFARTPKNETKNRLFEENQSLKSKVKLHNANGSLLCHNCENNFGNYIWVPSNGTFCSKHRQKKTVTFARTPKNGTRNQLFEDTKVSNRKSKNYTMQIRPYYATIAKTTLGIHIWGPCNNTFCSKNMPKNGHFCQTTKEWDTKSAF